MQKTEEDELQRKAEEQSHDEIADPEMIVDALTEEEQRLDIRDDALAAEEVGAPAKVAPKTSGSN